ncbi:MAG: hypothetical protein ACFE8U_15990 [Candidatus Hermodarchaeota archaeon]
MKKVYLIRKGVSLDQIIELIEFIDNYKAGLLKAIYFEENKSEYKGLTSVKNLMTQCKVVLLFIGTKPSDSQYMDEEIQLTHNLGKRRHVYSFDEEEYPPGSHKGIPSLWKLHTFIVERPTPSNVIRGIQGATKWGVS